MNFYNYYTSLLLERQFQNVNFVTTWLEQLKPKLVGADLGNLEIEEILNNKFKTKNIYFEFTPPGERIRDDFMEVYISHGYITADGDIYIGYTSDFYTIFEDDYHWESFCRVVKGIVSHELVHRDQFIKMLRSSGRIDGIAELDGSTYLAHPKEIQAFARQAVQEYLDLGYTRNYILQLLRTPDGGDGSQAHKEESNSFWFYHDYFSGEYGDPKVYRKFLKFMYQYLKTMEVDESLAIRK